MHTRVRLVGRFPLQTAVSHLPTAVSHSKPPFRTQNHRFALKTAASHSKTVISHSKPPFRTQHRRSALKTAVSHSKQEHISRATRPTTEEPGLSITESVALVNMSVIAGGSTDEFSTHSPYVMYVKQLLQHKSERAWSLARPAGGDGSAVQPTVFFEVRVRIYMLHLEVHPSPDSAVATHRRDLGPPRKRHDRAPELGGRELNRRVDFIFAVKPVPHLLRVRLKKRAGMMTVRSQLVEKRHSFSSSSSAELIITCCLSKATCMVLKIQV